MADEREHGLSIYLAEISRIPLLKPEEELRLARESRAGDAFARRRLTVANLRLVVSIAKKYLYFGLPLQDLIEEGNLGLMKAVDRYDPDRGCKFSTYATWWIRQSITRALSNYGRTVRIPVYVTDNIARYKKAVDELYKRTGKYPDVEDVAEAMGIKLAAARKLQEFVSEVAPMDNPEAANDEDGRGIPGNAEHSRENDAILQFERDQEIEALMEHLGRREASILRFRYGLVDGRAHTLEETGREFGLTRERIRQLENEALKQLRAFVKDHDDYSH